MPSSVHSHKSKSTATARAPSTSRPSVARNTTASSLPYVPLQPDSLILPDGPVGEEEAELLDELVHPRHRRRDRNRRETTQATLVGDEQQEQVVDEDEDEDGEDEDEEAEKRRKLPWWRRPSPWWILGIMPITAMAGSATIAPRIEIYTMLACSVHKPDIFRQAFPGIELGLQSFSYYGSDSAAEYAFVSDVNHAAASLHRMDSIAGVNQNSSTSTSTDTAIPIPIYLPQSQSPSSSSDRTHRTHHSHSESLESNSADEGRKRGNQCAADPVVQAAVAKLTAVIAGIMGVLSCITTGWWGAFSDRHGRTRVMALSVLGLLVTDINFIFVALFSKHIPGGYWFLVVAPFIEGGLGGLTTGVAALHAYMADTTPEGVRSRTFSLGLGLMFSGMACGPTVGALLIRASGHTLSVFYLATATHAVYTLLVLLVIPESLTRKQMVMARERYVSEGEGGSNQEVNAKDERASVRFLVKLRRLFAFLSPLTVFMPHDVRHREKAGGGSGGGGGGGGGGVDGDGDGSVSVNPLKKPRKDWNLMFVALAYAAIVSIAGSYSYKFQYAAATFGWTSEELGYWLSFLGITRAVFLTFILPLAIKILKPKPIIIEVPVQSSTATSDTGDESSPLLGSSSSTTTTTAAAPPKPKTIKKEIHSPSFDLKLLHFSVIIEIIAYTAMAFCVRPLPFTLAAAAGSLGAGFSPAMQSVALALYTRAGGTEVGRLFGALSVVQALSMQIFGPSLYGVIYVKTVAIFPRTIFFVTVFSVVLAEVFLRFVRLPKDSELRRQSMMDLEEEAGGLRGPGHAQEETLVGGGRGAAGASGSADEDQHKRLVDTPTTSYGTVGAKPQAG